MGAFKADHLEIEPHELVHFLLRETGQYDRQAVKPADMLEYLKLEFLSFEFGTGLAGGPKSGAGHPRALLSFPERIVAVDTDQLPERARFSVLHEIAHYVLPTHQYAMYLCDNHSMSPWTKLTFEKEANDFAADLLFKGGLFAVEASSLDVSVKSVVSLARRYEASFEATARRLAERSLRPVMLVSFKPEGGKSQIGVDAKTVWDVRYCIASPTFRSRYCTGVRGQVPPEVVAKIVSPFGDIEDSVRQEISIDRPPGKPNHFQAEFFYNRHNVFCLLTPAQ